MPALDSLFGQTAAVQSLRTALEQETLSGAYLFVGPEGSGKRTIALAFAQAAACLTPRSGPFDACGECESCRRFESGSHTEIIQIRPAGEQIQIWQLWDRPGRPAGVFSHNLSYAPLTGRRRVFVLEQADRLTEAAANSLLKILEEPPPYAIFLLTAPHPARVLPTILSRSQIVRVLPAPRSELAQFLTARFQADPARASMAAAFSEGRVGQAVTLVTAAGVAEEIARVIDFAESLPGAPRVRALRAAEQLRKIATQTRALTGAEPAETDEAAPDESEPGTRKEKTARRQFAATLDLLVTFYRDLLSLSSAPDRAVLVHADRVETLRRLSALGSLDHWAYCLDALAMCRRRLDANANTALTLEVLFMSLLNTV